MGKTFDGDRTKQDTQGEERTSDSSHTFGGSPCRGESTGSVSSPENAVATQALTRQSHFQEFEMIQRPPLEPFFQNLDASSRYYLNHFTWQVCNHMVAYDGPENPQRELVSAARYLPYLFHIMVANGAHHVHHLSCDFATSEKLLRYAADGQALAKPYAHTQKYHRDALVAKAKALRSLAQSVQVVTDATFDLLLSGILLFINYDLIESGKDQWQVHMEGAHRLVSFLGNWPFNQQEMSRLRMYQLSEYLK